MSFQCNVTSIIFLWIRVDSHRNSFFYENLRVSESICFSAKRVHVPSSRDMVDAAVYRSTAESAFNKPQFISIFEPEGVSLKLDIPTKGLESYVG